MFSRKHAFRLQPKRAVGMQKNRMTADRESKIVPIQVSLPALPQARRISLDRPLFVLLLLLSALVLHALFWLFRGPFIQRSAFLVT